MKLSESRKPYMHRLIAETLLGEYLPEKPSSPERSLYWLDRGIEMEAHAREAFTRQHNMGIDPIGFVLSEDGRLGCSPDGLITGTGEKECVEIKSPAPWTQIKYLLSGQDERELWQYRCQVYGQMIVGNFEACHFYSYHPRMPPKYVCTIPEMAFMTTLRQALADFIGDLDRETQKARELGDYVALSEVLGSAVGDE